MLIHDGDMKHACALTWQCSCAGGLHTIDTTHMHLVCAAFVSVDIEICTLSVEIDTPFGARNMTLNLKGEKPVLYCHNKTQRIRIGSRAADILSYYSRMGSFT